MGVLEVGISEAAVHLEEHWRRLQCLQGVLELLSMISPDGQRWLARVLAQMYEVEGIDGSS